MKQRVLIGLFIILAGSLQGYDVILPEDEDPVALFPVGRSDEDVSLFLAGSWEAAVSAGYAVQFIPGTGPVSITSFPDMAGGFGFSQTPDITLSVMFMNSYFFETTLADDFADSLFLLGYLGGESGLLRSLTIGNSETGMDSFSYLQLPDSPKNSLGLRMELAGESSRLDTVLRYDPAEERSQTYRGMNLVEEAEMNPAGYIRNRFFSLPDSDTESLRIFIQAPAGEDDVVLTDAEGREYVVVTEGEVSTSPAQGLITFPDAPAGRVLATYDGMTTSGSVLGVDLADRVETIDGTDYFILKEPGVFSPFEIQRYYTVPVNLPEESWRVRVYLKNGSFTPGESDRLAFRHYPEDRMIALTSGATDPFSDDYKYPLADDGFSHIYGPERENNPSYSLDRLLVQVLTPVESIMIDPEYLPASVRVYRNGLPETGFTVNNGGTLSFDRDITASDTLEIYYSVTSSSGEGGDLVFGTGGSFQPNPGLSFSGGLGVVWDILSGSYSTTAEDNPGSVLLTGGMEYLRDNLEFHLKTGLSVSNPDTSGVLRLKGMEESGFTAPISTTSVFPASCPPDRDPTHRGRLYYRDYVNPAAVSSALMPITWDDYSEEPYETGYRIGPYVAASGNSSVPGQVVGFHWNMEDTGEWVGGRLRLPEGDDGADVSGYRGVSFFWMGDGIDEDTDIEIQLGALPEDLDGDGSLDGEAGAFDDGFAFNDPATGYVLRVGSGPGGTGNGTLETEDADGDGLLQRENRDLTVSYSLDNLPPEEYWQRVRIFFTEAERKKLTACRGMQVIISSSTGDENTGTLYIADVRFEGSTFVPVSGTAELAQVAEDPLTDGRPAETLADAYPETERIFHADGSAQEVLDFRWTGDTRISSPVTPVRPDNYRRLVFYIAPLSVEGTETPEMTLSLADATGAGIRCTFNPAPSPATSPAWHKLEVDLEQEKAFLDGEDIDAEVTVDTDTGFLTNLTVSITGSTGGRMLIDEIAMTDPAASLAAGAEAELAWRVDGPLVSVGETPVLSDLRVSAFAEGSSSGFLRGITPGMGEPGVSALARMEATLLYTALAADLRVRADTGGAHLAGGHRLRFPANSATYIEDSYNHPGAESVLERKTSLVLNLPAVVACNLSQRAYEIAGDLVQDWTGSIKSSWDGPPAASLDFGLTAVSGAYTRPGTGYFGEWIAAYRLLAPADTSGRGERTGRVSGKVAADLTSFEPSLASGYSYILNETEQIQTSRGSITLAMPFSIGSTALDRVQFDIVYSRDITFTRDIDTSDGFGEDLALFTGGFGEQGYFFNNYPMYEIFSFRPDETFGTSGADDGTGYAEYTPSLSLSLQRRYGSFLRDLFLPASAEVEFSRELDREMADWTDRFVTEVSATTSALNLFGSRGAYPLFSWYRTDEFSGSVTTTYAHPLRGTSTELSVVYQGYLSFSLEEAVLTSDHRLDLDLSEGTVASYGGSVEYEHEKNLKKPPELPFITKVIEKPPVLSHNERVEFRWTASEDGSSDGWIFYGRHETAFILPEFGSIGIFGKVGVKPEVILSGGDVLTTWLAAIETGIEGNIRY